MKKDDITIDLKALNSITFPKTYKSFNDIYRELALISEKKPTEEQITELRSQSLSKHLIKLLKTYAEYDKETNTIYQIKSEPSTELDDGERLSHKEYFVNIIAKKINEEFKKGTRKFIMTTPQIFELGFLGKHYTDLRQVAKYALKDKDYDREIIKQYDLNNKDNYSVYVIHNVLDPFIHSTISGILKSLYSHFPNVKISKEPIMSGNELIQCSKDIYEAEKDDIKNIMEYERRESTGNHDLSVKIKVDYRTLPVKASKRYRQITKTICGVYENWVFELDDGFDEIKISSDKEIEKDWNTLNNNFILKFKQQTGYKKLVEYRNSYDYELLEREIDELEKDPFFSSWDFSFYNNYLFSNSSLIDNDIKNYLIIGKKSNSFFDIRYLGSYIYDLNKIIEYTSI